MIKVMGLPVLVTGLTVQVTGSQYKKRNRLLPGPGCKQMGARQKQALRPRLFAKRKVRRSAGPKKSLSLYNVRMRRWELWPNGWKGKLGPHGRKLSRKILNLEPTGFNGILWSCELGLFIDDSKLRTVFASICRWRCPAKSALGF